MRKSQRLRLRDLRNVYRLIGECRDLGTDAQVWYPHLLNGARQLVGVPVATGGQIEGRTAGRPLVFADMGWEDAKGRDYFHQWLAAGDMDSDLFYAAVCRLKQPLLTRHRRQLVADQEWYHSSYFNEYRKIGRVDDALYSLCYFPGDNLVQGIGLHRGRTDPPFGRWEGRVVHWLHHELAPLIGRQLAIAGHLSTLKLAPRLRETLRCLLEGDSEKQAALRLGLSRQTVHDYVKALYRRFGVSSRGELLALWIRRSSPGSPQR